MRCPSIDPRRAITPVAAAVITLGVATSAAASAAPASLTAGAATLQPPLVVAAGERGLVVARFGRARRLATRAPAGARDVLPRWSPDGRRVAFVRVAGNGDAALRVVDVATRRERALRRGSPAFAWAPDGTRIAVATLVRSTAWLAVHRPDGRLVERRRAFRAPQRRGWRAGLASLSWSRRGFLVGVLYCASECRGVDPASIRYFHVGGAGSPVLEIGRRQLHDPATTARPSPSGELIAFVADGKVYVQRLGGPTSAAADAPALLYARLAWSSDGRTVLAAGGDVLFAVDARTGRVERLAEGSERHAFHDVWAGHGGRLAVYVTGPRSFLELRSAATGALLARTRHSFGGDGDVRWP